MQPRARYLGVDVLRSRSLTERAIGRLLRDRLSMFAIGILLFITIASVGAPVIVGIMGVDPTTTDASESRYLPLFSEGHLLGTDNLGRDHLARLLYAGQVSLFIGFMSALLALVIGVTLGILTGYYGGLVDDLVNWIITTLNAIPGLVLLIVISAMFKPDANSLILGYRVLDLDGDHAAGPRGGAGHPRARIHRQRKSHRRLRLAASCACTSCPMSFR